MMNCQAFKSWEERVISLEKGNRVVHYYLKDSAGNSVLAVVGTERSIRHMIYVVLEEFLYIYGFTTRVHAETKWRARQEVVEWLTSVVSRSAPVLANNSMNCSSFIVEIIIFRLTWITTFYSTL